MGSESGPVQKAAACVLVIVFTGSCIGSIWTLVALANQSSIEDDVSSRASSMAAGDFESIDGGCTIVLANYSSTYSYAVSNQKCSKNCRSDYACSERRVPS